MIYSKKLQLSLLALIAVVFKEVFGMELTTQSLNQIATIAIALVMSYGLEDTVAIVRKSAKGKAQALWQSKRFWVAFMGVLTVVLAPQYHETAKMIVLILTGFTAPDLAMAGKSDK